MRSVAKLSAGIPEFTRCLLGRLIRSSLIELRLKLWVGPEQMGAKIRTEGVTLKESGFH
jgi:hypothetical protein